MGRFWEIIFDDNKNTFQIIGTSSNDTLLTHNVSEMIRAGMTNVRCHTPDVSVSRENAVLPQFKEDTELYSRLLLEYEKKTGKQLKRW